MAFEKRGMEMSIQQASNVRLIARLDIKGNKLIKGINLEGLRVIGIPNDYALKYYIDGIDELVLMDAVASLYGRNQLYDTIESAVKDIFVPITVGGGVRSVEDATQILRAGADKVAINTSALKNPELLRTLARRFGSSCVVLSVEAKQIGHHKWEAYMNNGRERSGRNVLEWVREAVSLGIGEILLTSIDREGTRKGFDLALVKAVTSVVSIPIIASGGMGQIEDLSIVVREGGADAIAMADILHYGRATVQEVRRFALQTGINVRKYV